MIFDANINLAAVIAVTLLAMLIGYVWYSQVVFGKKWLEAVDLKEDEIKEGSNAAMLGSLTLTLVMVYVLAQFVALTDATTIWDGAIVGVMSWVGFVLTTVGMNGLYEQKNRDLLAINLGHHFVVLAVSGAVLAVWV